MSFSISWRSVINIEDVVVVVVDVVVDVVVVVVVVVLFVVVVEVVVEYIESKKNPLKFLSLRIF